MMSKLDRLAQVFSSHVAIGWPASSSGAQRVIMVVYDPSDERALRKKIELFAQGTRAAGKSWSTLDVTPLVADWLAGHRYRDVYFEEPDELGTRSGSQDRGCDRREGRDGACSRRSWSERNSGVIWRRFAFCFTSLSDVLSRVEHAIQGRLLVFFPGRVQDGRYRLLDARESWDYHAVPITLDDHGDF